MAQRKKGEIAKYLKNLVAFEYDEGDPIKDDEKQKFIFHSMILNLEDVNVLYDFFKDFQEEFAPSSKTAIKNICQNIDYLNKQYGILTDDPNRADSMIFSRSTNPSLSQQAA